MLASNSRFIPRHMALWSCVNSSSYATRKFEAGRADDDNISDSTSAMCRKWYCSCVKTPNVLLMHEQKEASTCQNINNSKQQQNIIFTYIISLKFKANFYIKTAYTDDLTTKPQHVYK